MFAVKLWIQKNLLLVKLVVVVVMVVGAVFAKQRYDVNVGQAAVDKYEQQQEKQHAKDKEKVDASDRRFDGVPDCTILGSVYDTDNCNARQGEAETDIQGTGAAENPDTPGVGPDNTESGEGVLPVPHLFRDETGKERMCPKGYTLTIDGSDVVCYPVFL